MTAVSTPDRNSCIAQVCLRTWGSGPLGADGRASPLGGGGVFGDETSHRTTGERCASAGGEEGIGGLALAFFHPDPQDPDGVLGQRRGPLLPALARAANVGTGAQLDVLVAYP